MGGARSSSLPSAVMKNQGMGAGEYRVVLEAVVLRPGARGLPFTQVVRVHCDLPGDRCDGLCRCGWQSCHFCSWTFAPVWPPTQLCTGELSLPPPPTSQVTAARLGAGQACRVPCQGIESSGQLFRARGPSSRETEARSGDLAWAAGKERSWSLIPACLVPVSALTSWEGGTEVGHVSGPGAASHGWAWGGRGCTASMRQRRL